MVGGVALVGVVVGGGGVRGGGAGVVGGVDVEVVNARHDLFWCVLVFGGGDEGVVERVHTYIHTRHI